MGSVRRVAIAAAVAALLGPAAVVGVDSLLQPAAAASCAVMTISSTPKSLVRLTVNSVAVARGGCVEFANTTSGAVVVTVVGTSYSQTVPAKGTTSGSSNYLVTKTVTVQVSSGLRSGSGSITARDSSPTPTRSSTPTKAPTSTATPRRSPTTSASHKAARRHHHRRAGHRVKVSLPPLPPLPTNGLTGQPRGSNPVVAPGLTSATAAPTQPASGSSTTAVATVLDPVSGNKRGLPVLIAIALMVGLVAAYGRAVLAYDPAVDNRPQRGHRA